MARTTNEFGGGEIVPAIEAITGIDAPVRPDFVAVPFGTVNHEHGERRQIQNLANNLKSSSGIERIPFNGIDELDTEQGPNGEEVHALNTGDSRIRFVGRGWINVTSNDGTRIETQITGDYIEVTFFGTALNLLCRPESNGNWEAVVDGGTAFNIEPTATSNVLGGQNIKQNIILPVTSGLTAGVHTARITRRAPDSGTDQRLFLYGCEVINENAAITQQPGADFDGRVEALAATTFPIEPDNSTVPSVNGRDLNGTAATYGTHTAGARVLNYLTSGGQYKQSFNLADEAPGLVAGSQDYTIEINNGGSASVTIPTTVTSFIASTFGSGGGGGHGTGAAFPFGGSGGGGGGAGKAGATFTRSGSTQVETLALTIPGTAAGGASLNAAGSAGGTSTIITGGVTIGSAPGGGGGTAGFTAAGSGGAAGAIGTSQTFTGWNISSQTNTAGAAGSGGVASNNSSGGAGGNVGGFAITPLTGTEGAGGGGGSGSGAGSAGGAGNTPGGGGGGGGAGSQGFGNSGGVGAAGRVYLVITAPAGLSNTDFGVTAGEFTAEPLAGGDVGSPTAKFGNAAFDLNRLNQEVIRRINFREFGANNQWATPSIPTDSTLAFTLDDGTTSLYGSLLRYRAASTSLNLPEFIHDSGNGFTGGGYGITFVGTGLDVVMAFESLTTVNEMVNVDGLNIGRIPQNLYGTNPETGSATQANGLSVIPIVSGLPYGTHTVFFTRGSSPANNVVAGVTDYIIYGPKKPEIPTLDAGSLELSDYNIMADYSATTSGNINSYSKGVINKVATREILYAGTATRGTGVTAINGQRVLMDAGSGDYSISYTFYGTGFEANCANSTSTTNARPLEVFVDNAQLADRFTTVTVPASRYTGSTTSQWETEPTTTTGSPSTRIQVSGMPLGVHTVRFERVNVSNNILFSGFDVITPIHFQEDTLKVGSEGLNNLTVDPVVEEDEQVVLANLGEAKAWVNYDPLNDVVKGSFNVSAVVETTTNRSQAQIFFDKPFKDDSYVALSQIVATSPGSNNSIIANTFQQPNFCRIQTETANDTFGYSVAFFGELIDE